MQEESGKMTAQEYLGQVEQKIIAVRNINSGINNLKEMLFSLGGAGAGERVQASRENDKFGSIFAKIDEKERIMNEKSKEALCVNLSQRKTKNGMCRFLTNMEKKQRYMILMETG